MGADAREGERMRRRNSPVDCFEFTQGSAVRDCDIIPYGRPIKNALLSNDKGAFLQ